MRNSNDWVLHQIKHHGPHLDHRLLLEIFSWGSCFAVWYRRLTFFVLLDGFDTFVAAPFIRHGNWQVSVKGRGCVEDSTETSGAKIVANRSIDE
mmetsp:Transcript_20755/g.47045  ORF Transcript_20755/g.47045 Transcript_20755/m.47045 type:complete len:94 (+) Transcript_20755:735-1016(+)